MVAVRAVAGTDMARRLFVLLALGLLLVGPMGVRAQDGSPVAGGGASLDLAAMALAPGDVPEGFFDDYAEWWVPVESIDGVIGDVPPPEGLERAYQTFYAALDGETVIHVFLLDFGATAALAYQAAFNEDDPSTIDSAGIDFVVGSWLVTVDVQGGLSADAAMAAALDLATQQAGCLTAGGVCETVTRPEELAA